MKMRAAGTVRHTANAAVRRRSSRSWRRSMAALTVSQLPLSLWPVQRADQFLPGRHVPIGQHDRLDVLVIVIFTGPGRVVVLLFVRWITGFGTLRRLPGD